MVRILIGAAFIAIGLICVINGFAHAVKNRHREQLAMGQLQLDHQKLLGGVDNALLGEGFRDFDVAERKMNVSMEALPAFGNESELVPLHETYLKAHRAASEEIAAIRAGDIAKAKEIDKTETDPAFAEFEQAITAEQVRCQREADRWIRTAVVVTDAVLFSAAILLAFIAIRQQKSSQAVLALQMQRYALQTSERRFQSLIRNSSDVIAVVNAEAELTLVSDACERSWGRTAASLVGHSVFRLFEPADTSRLARILDSETPQTPEAMIEVKIADRSGSFRDYEVRYANLLSDPDVKGYLLTFHDLTERKHFEQQLAHHAFHDQLTSLPNRALFMDRLAHRLKTRLENTCPFAVLFIDLDNFKVINDSLGHEAGDTLLTEVGRRLECVLRPSDTVARIGGDEFTILLEDARTSADAIQIAERIRKTLARPSLLVARDVFVSASIGIVMSFDSVSDADGLLRDADTAMYVAKAHGKTGYVVFEGSMNALAENRLELESDLRSALPLGQLFLNYQPIVDIVTNEITAVEALVRWQHPIRGVVPPMAFIPLAEESGLICLIGQWVFQEACRQLATWTAELVNGRHLGLNVNVSARQLQERDFLAQVKQTLDEFHVDPTLIKLEITETAMLKDLPMASIMFDQLRALGLRVAIDDFGTGYSSISYLRQLPVDSLKIDRSFVIPLGEDGRADGVVQAMITMARTLGLDVTCEGIETAEQLEVLRKMGCDSGQGYLFARPLSAVAVTEALLIVGQTILTDIQSSDQSSFLA